MGRRYNQEPSDTLQDILALKERAQENRGNREPGRKEYVMKALREHGYAPEWNDADRAVRFSYKGNIVTVWPYKGYFSGKGVKDGRGIRKLLNQLDR